MQGDFVPGFQFFDDRFSPSVGVKMLGGSGGENLSGSFSGLKNNLVVIGEQGIGDQLFYLGFLPRLLSLVASKKVYVVLDKRLTPLFRSSLKIQFLSLAELNGLRLRNDQVEMIAVASIPEILVNRGVDIASIATVGDFGVPKEWLSHYERIPLDAVSIS